MDTLRRPLFLAALALIAIAVLVELGATGLLGGAGAELTALEDLIPASGKVRDEFDALDDEQKEELGDLANQDKPPGLAIRYLALVDGVLLFTVVLMGASLVIPERVHGRVQGLATLIFSILLILGAIVLLFAALLLVLLMISLLLSVPFGTLAYLALYGFFNRGGARVALGLLMALKLGFAVCLVLAHQRFLQNKGLVLLILTSLLGNVIINFLHGLVPVFLVSITDGIAAIIVAILAIIWAILLLIGSLGSVLKAIRLRA